MFCGNDTDDVSLAPELSTEPDIAVRSFAANTTGGMSFKYDVTGANLPSATTAAVYWVNAAGDIFGTPLFSQSTATTVGTHGPFNIPGNVFEERPLNAAKVALVLDQSNTLRESNESNNKITTDPVDPNDQISESISLGTTALTDVVTRFGNIAHLDVDMYSVIVQAGQKLAFDFDAPGGQGTIRIFDGAGNQLRDCATKLYPVCCVATARSQRYMALSTTNSMGRQR